MINLDWELLDLICSMLFDKIDFGLTVNIRSIAYNILEVLNIQLVNYDRPVDINFLTKFVPLGERQV